MDDKAFQQKMKLLRTKEIEARKKVVAHVREIDRRKIWKKYGYKSLKEFCLKHLRIGESDLREILIATGEIVTKEQMNHSDPKVQKHIDQLMVWRKEILEIMKD